MVGGEREAALKFCYSAMIILFSDDNEFHLPVFLDIYIRLSIFLCRYYYPIGPVAAVV